jgi:signal transduction histidine kinase
MRVRFMTDPSVFVPAGMLTVDDCARHRFPGGRARTPTPGGKSSYADFPAVPGIGALVLGIALRHHDRMQRVRRSELAVSPLGAAAVVLATLVTIAACVGSAWISLAEHDGVLSAVFGSAVPAVFAVVGALVAAARPGNRVGWFLLVGAACWSLGSLGTGLAHHAVVAAPGSISGASFYAVAGAAVRSIGWYLLILGVPMYFPDGRIPAPRWRWLPKALAVVLVAGVVDPLFDPKADLTDLRSWRNPVSTDAWWGHLLSAAGFLASIPLSLVAEACVVAALIGRWRRGGSFERHQLTLFAAAAALPILAAPVSFADHDAGWVFSVSALPLPIAIGFAVLARGLYDLRTAVNRTLVWVILSALVAGVYALVIVVSGGVVHAGGAPWLPWLAAGVIALGFAPLRDVLQRGVNRLTFGKWDEPYDVLATLGKHLEASADVDRLLAEVIAELRDLGLSDIAITDEHGVVIAGGPDVGDRSTPITAYGRPVGRLRYRSPDMALRERDRRLLDDLTGHLGGYLHARRLTDDLQRALDTLVRAREEERRRLRRDLHDGLGPALAGHLLRVDVISRKVGTDSPARADIDALQRDLRTTVLDIRRLVEGLRPPALDELGLGGAIEQAAMRLSAGSPLRVDVDVAVLPELPAATEVAAYRIVTEAVTNVVRHAGATRCEVRVGVDGPWLSMSVHDNGHGFFDGAAATGNGLQTMRERVDEVRGRLRVSGQDGTLVEAELPVVAVP